MLLATGSEVVLSPQALTPHSSATNIGVSVPELVESLQEGDKIALGDGGVSLDGRKTSRLVDEIQGRRRRQGPGPARRYGPRLQAGAQDAYS